MGHKLGSATTCVIQGRLFSFSGPQFSQQQNGLRPHLLLEHSRSQRLIESVHGLVVLPFSFLPPWIPEELDKVLSVTPDQGPFSVGLVF